jgi:hypothetical protein
MRNLSADPYRHMASLDSYILVWRENGKTNQERISDRLSSMHFEDTEPVRAGSNYQHRRHYEGMYPVLSTGQAVWYESMLELQCLTQLEHSGDLAKIATQPMCFVGPDRFRHYPDFFYRRRSDGAGVVVDVRAANRIDQATSARYELTAELCHLIGWDYEIMNGLTGWAAMNLEWLAAFRHPRFDLTTLAMERLMLNIACPLPFIEVANLINPEAPEAGKAALYHLLWTREVAALSDGPFFEDMLVTAAVLAE